MRLIFSLKILVGLMACAGWQATIAQTNVTYQNCHVGDWVRVKCDQPMLVLGKATLLEIGSNTVTVVTTIDRFTLNKSNVILVALGNQVMPVDKAFSTASSESALMVTPPAKASFSMPASATGADGLQTMESIRAAVIDPYKKEAYREPKLVNGKWELVVNPSSAKGQAKVDQANQYYHETMSGVLNGSVSQAALVNQAKHELAECDKYAAERKDDPQYEEKIKTLRDFVRRSEAGEKFDFTPTVP